MKRKNIFVQIEDVSRLVVHDWEREYYRTGIKELGFKVEKEVNLSLSLDNETTMECMYQVT